MAEILVATCMVTKVQWNLTNQKLLGPEGVQINDSEMHNFWF